MLLSKVKNLDADVKCNEKMNEVLPKSKNNDKKLSYFVLTKELRKGD